MCSRRGFSDLIHDVPEDWLDEGFWRGYRDDGHLDDANRDLLSWLIEQKACIHGTTRQRVDERDGLSALTVLDRLLETEVASKEERRIGSVLKLASLPFIKTIDEYDFTFNPELEKARLFLRAAVEYGLLSTPQFLILFSESRDAVYRRLQVLFHHGYLDRLKGDPSSPMVYALGRRGAELLVEQGYLEDKGEWSKKTLAVRERYVAHQAMITNFRIGLTLACQDRPDVRLLFFQREGLRLRDRVTAPVAGRRQTIPINPDGFFGLQLPDRPEGRNRAFFFLEADRSTMTGERVLRKLLGYWAWFGQGGHTEKHGIKSFRVLTVTKSEARLRHLLGLVRREEALAEARPMLWFASEERYRPGRPGSLREAIWETAAHLG